MSGDGEKMKNEDSTRWEKRGKKVGLDFNYLCPRHSKNGGGALSVTPVRVFVRPFVCPSVIQIWCPLNNFWKTASIQFKFGVLIYNIKTQVKFDLGYNPLIFDGVMGLL